MKRSLFLLFLCFFLGAIAATAQSTEEVCRETQKVMGQYENEAKEQKVLLEFKTYESRYKDKLSNLNRAITTRSLLAQGELEEIADMAVLPMPKASGRMTVEERQAFQIELRTEMTTAVEMVADQNLADIRQQYNLINQQLNQRKERYKALNCDEVLKRGAYVSDGWSGTWARTDGVETLILSSSGGGSLSAKFTYAGAGFSGNGEWSKCKVDGNTATCDWKGSHDDNTKSGTRTCTVTATLDGNNLSVKQLEEEPDWKYKPPNTKDTVQSVMYKGKLWDLTYTRK